jgi:hypothetical protein
MAHTYLEVHGVRLDVEITAEALIPAIEAILPPGWQPTDAFPEDGHLVVAPGAGDGFDVSEGDVVLGSDLPADVAVHLVDAEIRRRVASLARDRVFVHAGAVAMDDRVLVLPGPTFTGKSTLVAALVARGATYYSDEYAVLDQHGMVHPFPRPLSIRANKDRYGDYTPVETLGGKAGTAPGRVAVIAVCQYERDAKWAPTRLSPTVGGLRLLANTVPARLRPAEAMAAVGRASAPAVTLEGPRGEADETAGLLLDELSRIQPP